MSSEKSLTPQIRFKGFTEAWEQRKLGEVSPLRGGFAFKSSEYKSDGIPIIRIGNILSDGTIGSDFLYFDEQKDDSLYSLYDGSVLLAMSGATTGKTSVLRTNSSKKYYQNQRVGFFTPTEKSSYDFVMVLVQTEIFTKQLKSVLVAGAQPNISSKDVDSFIFRFPNQINEQIKIGSFFKYINNLITLHQRKLDALKKIKSALLEKMFPKDGSNIPEIRFTGFTEAWEQRKLSELYAPASEKNDGSFGRDKIISVANMYFNPVVYVTDDDYLKTYNVMRLGDIAFEGNRSKRYAHGRFVENFIGDGIISHVFKVFRPRKPFDLLYWKYAINNELVMRDVLTKSTKASTMMHELVSQDFLKEGIVVPSCLDEQRHIGALFARFDNLITLHQRKLDALKKIKSALLEKMFV